MIINIQARESEHNLRKLNWSFGGLATALAYHSAWILAVGPSTWPTAPSPDRRGIPVSSQQSRNKFNCDYAIVSNGGRVSTKNSEHVANCSTGRRTVATYCYTAALSAGGHTTQRWTNFQVMLYDTRIIRLD